ncbi:MAG: hypothetical protein IPL33_16145 [Sphingobacteriales bacterium]|nr:hypothetical protein [Sphingobacteriales bacterium]
MRIFINFLFPIFTVLLLAQYPYFKLQAQTCTYLAYDGFDNAANAP